MKCVNGRFARGFVSHMRGGLLVILVVFTINTTLNAQVLLHRYSFNDGTANDSVGTANGTLTGGATISGGALIVPSAGYNVGAALPLSATSGIDGSFTIEDWFTRSGSGGDFTTLFTFGSSTSQYLLSHPQRTDSNDFTIEYENGDFNGLNDATPLSPGAEYMIATTYDASTDLAVSYLDGSVVASQTISEGFDLGQIASGGFNGIGGFDAFGDGATPGATDEFRIYSGALSEGQITTDYAVGPNIVVVPEPASLSLLTVSVVGLMAWRRRVRSVEATVRR
jgi:hypothetical protein